MINKIKSIEDIVNLTLSNPSLAEELKKNPTKVAKSFGVTLTAEEQKAIKEQLDIDEVLKRAKEVDSFAAKVIAGVGIKRQS